MFKRFRTTWYGPFSFNKDTGEFDHVGFEVACTAMDEAKPTAEAAEEALALKQQNKIKTTNRKLAYFIVAVSSVLAFLIALSAHASSESAAESVAFWRTRHSVPRASVDDHTALTVAVNVDRKLFSKVGEIITFRYDILNSGNQVLTGGIFLADSHVQTKCAAVPVDGMKPQQLMKCTGQLTVTRSDLEAGEIRHSFAALNAKGLSSVYEAVLCSKQKITACKDESNFICSDSILSKSKLIVREYCEPAGYHSVMRSSNNCLSISGTVFRDSNRNGLRDVAEDGIMFTELYSASGELVRTDENGNYNLDCAEVSKLRLQKSGGLKLDVNSLPEGYRAASEWQVIRVGRQGATTINFPIKPPRIIRLALKKEAFIGNTTALRIEWQKDISRLLTLLQLEPAILQLAYETSPNQLTLAKGRVDAVKRTVKKQWKKRPVGWKLIIESHIEKRLQQAGN
jgi:hypothetical protein